MAPANTPENGSCPRFLFAALAVALWLLLLAFSRTDLSVSMRPAQLVAFFAAFAVFCLAVGLVWRLGHRLPPRVVWFILLVGVFYRVSLAPMRPVTTSDVYRYLWEGRVINRGHNPFREPPDSPALAPLRDWVWSHLEFKQVPAAYPPAAQYVFALADRLPADRITTLKLVFAAFDIGTVFVLYGLLIRLRRPRGWILLYAWHPLIVGEVVARGHFDSVGIFFLALALWLFTTPSATLSSRATRNPERPEGVRERVMRGIKTFGADRREATAFVLSGAALAASVLAKGYALFTLPFFLLAARPQRGWWALGLTITAVVLYLPFASAGTDLSRGLEMYSTQWHGYASVYHIVRWIAGGLAKNADHAARATCALLFLAWLTFLAVRSSRLFASSPLRLFDVSFLALAAFFLLSPVLYTWYLSWTVPFLCLRKRPAWLLFTGTEFLFYTYCWSPLGSELWWVKVLEYGPPLALALFLAARRGRSLPEPWPLDPGPCEEETPASPPKQGETLLRP